MVYGYISLRKLPVDAHFFIPFPVFRCPLFFGILTFFVLEKCNLSECSLFLGSLLTDFFLFLIEGSLLFSRPLLEVEVGRDGLPPWFLGLAVLGLLSGYFLVLDIDLPGLPDLGLN